MTINEWFDTWLELYKRRKCKIGSIETYKYVYNNQIQKELGAMQIEEIKPYHLQRLLNDLADNEYSDGTIQLAKTILTGMFREAVRNEVIIKNPSDYIEIPKGKPLQQPVAFTKDEQAIFVEYAKRSSLCNLFLLGLYTGMRGGELCALQWSDIDFDSKTINIQHTLKFVTGKGYLLDKPKTISSCRQIPMMPQAEELLRKQTVDTDFVFAGPVTKNQLQAAIKRILGEMKKDSVDFPYFTMHSTRHTFATRCAEAGMKPEVLQHILGHSELSTTMDIYVSVQADEKAKQIAMVADLF